MGNKKEVIALLEGIESASQGNPNSLSTQQTLRTLGSQLEQQVFDVGDYSPNELSQIKSTIEELLSYQLPSSTVETLCAMQWDIKEQLPPDDLDKLIAETLRDFSEIRQDDSFDARIIDMASEHRAHVNYDLPPVQISDFDPSGHTDGASLNAFMDELSGHFSQSELDETPDEDLTFDSTEEPDLPVDLPGE